VIPSVSLPRHLADGRRVCQLARNSSKLSDARTGICQHRSRTVARISEKVNIIDVRQTFPREALRAVIRQFGEEAWASYKHAPSERHVHRHLDVLFAYLCAQDERIAREQATAGDGILPFPPRMEVCDWDAYWGLCPKCHQSDGRVDFGRSHWGVCDVHRVRWAIGGNLFTVDDETEEEVAQKAAYDYLPVEPVDFDLPGQPLMLDGGPSEAGEAAPPA
jgi:hypothetical protein